MLLFPLRLLLAVLYITTITATRSLLIVSWCYLLLYFVLSSQAARENLEASLAESLPGTVKIGGFQWGPWPGSILAGQIEILDPSGETVLTVSSVAIDVDLSHTLMGLAQHAFGDGQPIVLKLEKLKLVEPHTDLAIGADGRLNLSAALSDGKGPDRGIPKGLELSVDELIIEKGGTTLQLEGVKGSARGLNVVARGGLDSDGTFHYFVIKGRLDDADVEGDWPLGPDGEAPEAARFTLQDLILDRTGGTQRDLKIAGLSAHTPDGELKASGTLEFSKPGLGWVGEAECSFKETSKLVPFLTRHQVDGAFSMKVAGKGAEGELELTLESAELWAFGFPLEELSLKAKANLGEMPSLRLESFTARALGGHILLEDASVTLGKDDGGRIDILARLQLTDVDPFAVLGSIWVNVQPGALAFTEGWLQGTLRVGGSYYVKDRRLELDAFTERLAMRWDGAAKIPLAPEYSLGGGFHLSVAPGETGSTLQFENLTLKSGADQLTLNGQIQPAKRSVNADLDLHVHELRDTLSAFLPVDMAGSVNLKRVHLSGHWLNPTVKGDFRWSRAKIAGRRIGHVTAGFELAAGQLKVNNLRVPSHFGSLKAQASLRLFDATFEELNAALPFRVQRLTLEHIALQEIWPKMGWTTDFGFELTREIRGNLRDALRSIQGSGRLVVDSLASAKHRVRKLTTNVVATVASIKLEKVKLTLCRRTMAGGCLAGGPSLAGSVAYRKRSGTLSSTIELKDFPLQTLKQFIPNFGFEGDVWATLRAEGKPSAPRVMGTVRAQGLKMGGIMLGDASFELSWGERPGDIVIHSSEFFDSMSLEESELRFSDLKLQKVALRATTQDLRLGHLFPALKSRAFKFLHRGNVEFSYQPGRPEPWQIRAYAKAGDVSLELHESKVRYSNDNALMVRVNSTGVTVDPVTLKAEGGSTLDLCGRMAFEGALAFETSGRFGAEIVRPVRALRDAFSRVEGAIEIGAASTARGPNSCLPLSKKHVLFIGGTPTQPTLSGRLVTRGLNMIPRGLGKMVTVDDESSITLVPGDLPGRQLIRFPQTERFSGTYDEGSFQVLGDIELMNFGLQSVQLNVVGTDITHASGGEYTMTFNPDLWITVTDFSNERMRRMTLAGEVEVTDGTYYKSFDQLAKVVGAVTGNQFEEFSQPLTEKLPWLKSLVLDLGVRSTGHNLNVSSSFPLGSTDLDARLDLKIQGTLDRLQVFNRVDLAQGGTVTYDILSREFEVLHGYLDFSGDAGKPRIDVRAQAIIEYLESSRSGGDDVEEKSVTVTVSITGVLPNDLEIELTGSPGGFDEGDLQSLLLTGKPISDSAMAREDYQFNVPVGTYLKELLASPFVESVNVGLDSQGDWASEILTRLGRYASLQARAEGESGASTRLSARFQLHLSDSVVLEGNVDRETGTTTSANEETYEARIKYRYIVD